MPRDIPRVRSKPNVMVFFMTDSQGGLQSIIETMEKSAPGKCLAIFDLDSTLYDLTLRITAILDRFANDPAARKRFPDACRLLADVEIRRTDWGLVEPLERIAITKKTHVEFFSEIHTAWAIGFFSNDFLDKDFPLPGAVEFVARCLEARGEVLEEVADSVMKIGNFSGHFKIPLSDLE